MSLIVFKERGYQFYFLSKNNEEMHVHVVSVHGEAKYWLEPKVKLARNKFFTEQHLKEIRSLIDEHHDEIIDAWLDRFFS